MLGTQKVAMEVGVVSMVEEAMATVVEAEMAVRVLDSGAEVEVAGTVYSSTPICYRSGILALCSSCCKGCTSSDGHIPGTAEV